MSFFGLHNPIPHERPTTGDMREWMRGYRVVPYYGDYQTGSHRFLELLRDLCELSPTYGAVMEVRQSLTFGSRLRVCGRAVPGLAGERSAVDYATQVAFVEVLDGFGLTLTDIVRMSREMDEHLDQSGNAYLAITRVRVGEATAYRFEVLHYLHCIYTLSEDPGEYFLLHSRHLGYPENLTNHPPRLYRVTRGPGEPLRWMTDRDDPTVERTVIHRRAGRAVDDGQYYGRSPLIRNLTHLYIDFQQGNHVSKVAATQILVKKLIALEGPDPNAIQQVLDADGKEVDTFLRDAKMIRELITSVQTPGNALGPRPGQAEVATVQFPYGGKPPETIDFEVNHDTKYLDWQAGYAADRVAAALSWDTTLTSLRKVNASLGGNLLFDTLLEKKIEVTDAKQDEEENLWNGTLAQLMEDAATPAPFSELGIEFPDRIGELLQGIRPVVPLTPPNGTPAGPDGPEEESDELPDTDSDAATNQPPAQRRNR